MGDRTNKGKHPLAIDYSKLDRGERAARLREALQAEDEKRSTKTSGGGGGDSAVFPFWSIPEGSTATVRFLPDGDPTNPLFWVNQEIIKLTFAGQVGGDFPTDQTVEVKVPCMEMYGEVCPIVSETRPWWKQGAAKEALARQYYKKKTYIFQGFVVSSKLEEADAPVNPIRRFVISPSIFKLIREALMNPDMEDLCTDYEGGRDFKITRSKVGDFANYSTSNWSFKTRPLLSGEMGAIETYGLFNLSDFKGVGVHTTQPDAEGVGMIKAMFHDSLAGKSFDFTAYGHSYRGYAVGHSVPGAAVVPGASRAPELPSLMPTAPVLLAPSPPVGLAPTRVPDLPAGQIYADEIVDEALTDDPNKVSAILDRIRRKAATP
jgi:hypothetical protein